MSESLEVKKYYVWESTFLKGTPEVYLAENEELVFFESGRTANKNDFELQLSKITEEDFDQLNKSSNTIDNVIIQNDFFANIPLGNPDVVIQEPIEQNPIQIILDKQKKLEETQIAINLTLNLPSKKAVEFLNMMFDEEEVFETLSNFVLKQLDETALQEFVKEAIIKNYTDAS